MPPDPNHFRYHLAEVGESDKDGGGRQAGKRMKNFWGAAKKHLDGRLLPEQLPHFHFKNIPTGFVRLYSLITGSRCTGSQKNVFTSYSEQSVDGDASFAEKNVNYAHFYKRTITPLLKKF